MIPRPFWTNQVKEAWESRSIVWLTGVRRIGKTVLTRQINDVAYLNCDRPSTRRELADPELFLAQARTDKPIVLDEIHRLDEPTTLLKLSADEYPEIRILATGSSTLGATQAFRDTLAGRKVSIRLLPALWRERERFEVAQLDLRLLRGGFPEVLLAETLVNDFIPEWLDSYFARDIAELFSIRNRSGYLRVVELLMRRSGGELDVTNLSKEGGVSRPTVISYLDAMELSNVIHRLRPYHAGGSREVVKRPKVYAFDTGAVCWVRGWDSVRDSDRGILWEHLVLDELRASVGDRCLRYWRDRSGREIDFVVPRRGQAVDIVEAKINPSHLDPQHIQAFRSNYPEGDTYVAVPYAERPSRIRIGDIVVTVCEPASIPA